MINKYGVASSELTPLDCYTNHSSYLHSKLEQVELGNIKFIDFYRFLEAGINVQPIFKFKDEGLVNLYEPYFIQKYSPKYNKDLLNYQK